MLRRDAVGLIGMDERHSRSAVTIEEDSCNMSFGQDMEIATTGSWKVVSSHCITPFRSSGVNRRGDWVRPFRDTVDRISGPWMTFQCLEGLHKVPFQWTQVLVDAGLNRTMASIQRAFIRCPVKLEELFYFLRRSIPSLEFVQVRTEIFGSPSFVTEFLPNVESFGRGVGCHHVVDCT